MTVPMDAAGYRLLKQLDAGLSPAVSDPAAALTAIQALTDTVVVDVKADDIRSLIWSTLEGAAIKLLSEVRTFSTTAGDGKPPKQLIQAAMTAGDFLSSGRMVHVSDTAYWQQILTQMDAFVAATALSQNTRDKVAAMRTVVLPKLRNAAGQPYAATPSDLIAARSQF